MLVIRPPYISDHEYLHSLRLNPILMTWQLMRTLNLGLPTPNPSQEGNVPTAEGDVFPSWEGLGVGNHASDDEIFQITFQVV